MRGDINATELYTDREFLVRVGLGMLDVESGSTGGVGFEDVKRFSYVDKEEQDPKMYRRKVYHLTGHYYSNDLARVLWDRFEQHQLFLSEKAQAEVSLKEAAGDWLEHYGHNFFKAWTLQQQEVPFRMRNREEPRRGWINLMTSRIAPQWRELLEAGFSVPAVLMATLATPSRTNRFLRVAARVSGYRITSAADVFKRRSEIEELEQYLSRQTGYSVGFRLATIEYFRRLSLVAEMESPPVCSGGSLAALA